MASQINMDPFDAWRQALSKLESGINALSNRSMNSDQFTQILQSSSALMLGMQQATDKALRQHFKLLNLPSRQDVEALSTALQRVEEKLDQLVAQPTTPAGSRPARTRQPPVATSPAPVPTAVEAAPPRRRAATSRRKGGAARTRHSRATRAASRAANQRSKSRRWCPRTRPTCRRWSPDFPRTTSCS
jgi:hypothetical protein